MDLCYKVDFSLADTFAICITTFYLFIYFKLESSCNIFKSIIPRITVNELSLYFGSVAYILRGKNAGS